VAPAHCCAGAPSEPCVPVVPAHGSSKPGGLAGGAVLLGRCLVRLGALLASDVHETVVGPVVRSGAAPVPEGDPLRNDVDHGGTGHGIEPSTLRLPFRLWDGSNVPQPEGRDDRDAGGGWRRQFLAMVMQTGGSGLSTGWAPSAPQRSTTSVVAARAAASTTGELQVAPAVSGHQRAAGRLLAGTAPTRCRWVSTRRRSTSLHRCRARPMR